MSWFSYLLAAWAIPVVIGPICWWPLIVWHRARLIAYHCGSAAEQAALEAFYDAYQARELSLATGGCELAWQEELERIVAARHNAEEEAAWEAEFAIEQAAREAEHQQWLAELLFQRDLLEQQLVQQEEEWERVNEQWAQEDAEQEAWEAEFAEERESVEAE